jgi:hypothetical protein
MRQLLIIFRRIAGWPLWARFLLLLGNLFGLYVLSTGPVVGLVQMLGLSETSPIYTALETFYLPLIVLCEWCDPIEDFFNWYTELWVFT